MEEDETPKEQETKEENLVDKAQKVADSLKVENDRAEKLAAQRAFGGKTESAPIEKKKEVSAEDYAKALLQGKVLK